MNPFYNAGIAAYSAAVHLAAVRSPKAAEGRAILTRLYDDPVMRRACGAKAGKYIKDNIGATDLIYEEISQNILKHD